MTTERKVKRLSNTTAWRMVLKKLDVIENLLQIICTTSIESRDILKYAKEDLDRGI